MARKLARSCFELYNGTPSTIIDTLPALMNSIKMIHTIARYYNTTERMTNLFIKITNQMITNCKSCINANEPPEALWERPGLTLAMSWAATTFGAMCALVAPVPVTRSIFSNPALNFTPDSASVKSTVRMPRNSKSAGDAPSALDMLLKTSGLGSQL